MLKARQRLGKYKITGHLGSGGFAEVYSALDTIEGSRVALKVAHKHLMSKEVLEDFYREVRLASRLDHPNILALKNADFIDDQFVISSALGEETLTDRLMRRMSLKTALSLADQAIDSVAFAHGKGVIHCDIKPDNYILFPDHQLRLTDFGLAKVARRTIHASGSGTVGYLAPEQAMGRPSQRSDVFSLGLILCQLILGVLPAWPFDWPPPGMRRSRAVHPEMMALLARSIAVDQKRRFRSASQLLEAFRKLKPKTLAHAARKKAGAKSRKARRQVPKTHWKEVRFLQFQRRYGKRLDTRFRCAGCDGPISETMRCCPWCGADHKTHDGEVRFPGNCGRCGRGLKRDWRFCPWCYGPGFDVQTTRRYSDKRYTAKCSNRACGRKNLMPFMTYCPWCRTKVRRKWEVAGSKTKCPRCRWGTVAEYWDYCPWCARRLHRR